MLKAFQGIVCFLIYTCAFFEKFEKTPWTSPGQKAGAFLFRSDDGDNFSFTRHVL